MRFRRKSRQRAEDLLEGRGSHGPSPEGVSERNDTGAGEDGPSPDAPGPGPPAELDEEFAGPPPEWIECYRAANQADAALMADYLERHGITTRLIQDLRMVTGQAMIEVHGVLIRTKDIPRERRLTDRIERRRARRQRPAEFPWGELSVIALFTLMVGAGVGSALGGAIGGAVDRELAGQVVGGGLGFAAGLSLMIRLYRVRRRADAAAMAAEEPAGGSA
jgi:hypothetical protein